MADVKEELGDLIEKAIDDMAEIDREIANLNGRKQEIAIAMSNYETILEKLGK